MCSSDFSLKLIAAACLLIIVTDSFVLQQILEKQDIIHLTSSPEVYQDCYKPQIRMRVIFTAYAILSASVCFVLTMALMCCDEFSEWFDKIVNGIAEFMYAAFGPVLFTFCLFGLFSIPELAHECHPTYISDNLNLMDITILLICTGLSFCIVFIYALQHTNRLAEKDLSDEHSVFYQVFSTWLNRQRHNYHQERKRRLAQHQRHQQIIASGRGLELPFTNGDEEEDPSAVRAGGTNESTPLQLPQRADLSEKSGAASANQSYTEEIEQRAAQEINIGAMLRAEEQKAYTGL